MKRKCTEIRYDRKEMILKRIKQSWRCILLCWMMFFLGAGIIGMYAGCGGFPDSVTVEKTARKIGECGGFAGFMISVFSKIDIGNNFDRSELWPVLTGGIIFFALPKEIWVFEGAAIGYLILKVMFLIIKEKNVPKSGTQEGEEDEQKNQI